MAGRPSLRIGEHGKIRRVPSGGVWLAFCHFRDTDGVTRRVQRVGPADAHDKRGKLAEDVLIEALGERRPPSEAGPDAIGPDTLVMALLDQHLARLAEDGRSVATLATYKFAANKLRKFDDLVDPITVLAATGLRESELLGLRWVDFDVDAGTLTVTGKLVRATGYGLTRVDQTKSAAGKRTLPLPRFAIDALTARRALPFLGEQKMIFPSTAGMWRDPNNFNKQWRQVRDGVGGAGVTTHSFRKTVATLIDGGGLSARIGADHLGHTNVSMTQDRYMARGRSHIEVADLLDRAINVE